MLTRQPAISPLALLGQNFHSGKPPAQAGALQFVMLFGNVALGHQMQFMAVRQHRQGCCHALQKLNLLLCDGLREALDPAMLLARHRCVAQLFKALHQRSPEALHSVSMLRDRSSFHGIQVRTNLLRTMNAMVEVVDKGRDGPLKVNIVLPQRVVRVKQQRLTGVGARRKVRVWIHPPDCSGNDPHRCYTRLNSPMTNFMRADIAGAIKASLGFPCLLFAPGYLLAATFNLFGFRVRNPLEQSAWAVALSFAISPIVAVLMARITSIGVVAVLFQAAAAVTLVLFLAGRPLRKLRMDRNLCALALFLAFAVAILVASLVDIQRGDKLFLSVSVLDQAYRVAFINGIAHSGIPPGNPLYHPGVGAPLRYYYFWYALCAVCMKIAHASARQALMASSCWVGIGLVAVISLYARHFLQVTVRLYRFILVAVLLLTVTGLDILPVFYNIVINHDFAGDLEWWSADQITSWFDSMIWVPNHVAALLACLVAFLLLWCCKTAPARRDRIPATLLAGFAAASAFGLSIYVAAGFALLMLLWLADLLLRQRDASAAGRAAATPALASLLLLPYLRDLLATSSSTGHGARAGVGHLFQFGVRKMIDSDLIAAMPVFAEIRSRHPVLLDQALRLLLLLPGYALELGFFGLVLILAIRNRRSLQPPFELALWFSVAGLVLVSLVRSAVIGNNDFGYRAALIPSFFLLILAADRMTSAASRSWLAILLIVGLAGTAFQALMLRIYVPLHVTARMSGFDGLPEAAYAARTEYAAISDRIPADAILQPDLADPGSYFSVINMLYSERAMATDGAQDCGAVFGGDPALCANTQAIVHKLFAAPAPSGEVARNLCHSAGIGYLAVSGRDPAWRNATGWVWTLPAVTGGTNWHSPEDASANATFRVVQCGTGTR